MSMYVPRFNNRAADYKGFKKPVQIYDKKMQLAGRSTEMAALIGRAWGACEDLAMAVLESANGTSVCALGPT